MLVQPLTISAVEIQGRLRELRVERALASAAGLAADGAYMADLDSEIADTLDAYVGTAVTEIATLRAEISGPQAG